jgi:hypothetical protein
MTLAFFLLALALQSPVVLEDAVVEIPPSDWREFDFPIEQAPMDVNCHFEVVTQPGAVRVVFLSKHDLQQFARNLPYGFLRSSAEQDHGVLGVSIRQSGDYALLVINGSNSPASAQVHLQLESEPVKVENTLPVRYLSPRRRVITLLASFIGFFVMVSWSASRLLKAMRGSN